MKVDSKAGLWEILWVDQWVDLSVESLIELLEEPWAALTAESKQTKYSDGTDTTKN